MAHTPRKQARQARARATRDAIVEAAARILEQEGSAAATTNRIAERAGVSIGSLYQYFPDKQCIFAELLRRERAVLLADVKVAAKAGGAPVDLVAALADVALRHQFARPAMALQLEYLETELDLDEEVAALAGRLEEEIAAVLRRIAPDAGPHAARDTVAIGRALVNAAALAGETEVDAIRRRLVRAIAGYLWPPALPGTPYPRMSITPQSPASEPNATR